MVDQDATAEITFGQEVAECDLRSGGDVLAEQLPAALAVEQCRFEFLLDSCQMGVLLRIKSSLAYLCDVSLSVQISLSIGEGFVRSTPACVDLFAIATDTGMD